ncbi:MAG: DUF4375 domain-containing protein [Phycisphaerales bacterium]
MTTDRSLFEDRIELLLANQGHPSVDGDGFTKMDPHQKRMAALFILENEVAQGGFSKAYFSQSPLLGEIAAEGYEVIGARDHARVVRASLEAAKKSEKSAMLQTLSEEHIRSGYAAVDRDWAALSGNDTSSLKVAYMKQHPKSFGIVFANDK